MKVLIPVFPTFTGESRCSDSDMIKIIRWNKLDAVLLKAVPPASSPDNSLLSGRQLHAMSCCKLKVYFFAF